MPSSTPTDLPPPSQVAPNEVTRGIHSAALAKLVEQYAEHESRTNPTWASATGDHRFDGEVEDLSPEARAQRIIFATSMQRSLQALPLEHSEDQLSRELLVAKLHSDLLNWSCAFEEWQFSARDNPMVNAGNVASTTVLTTPEDATHWIERIDAFTKQLAVDATNRELGAARLQAPTKTSVQLVLDQVRPAVAAPPDAFPLMEPLKTLPEQVFNASIVEQTREAVVRYQIALGAWVKVIEAKVLPIARDASSPPGLVGLEGGEPCYAAMIEHHTSLPLSAADVHQTGLDEIRRLRQEISMLGKRSADRSDVQDLFNWLRTDPGLYFRDEAEIEAKANEALNRAKARIPDYFGILPTTDCGVERIPSYLAPYTTIAYYQPLTYGERPGTYFVNTYQPTTRPRHEAEVLAFHESIPGHHLQIAIAQERTDLPAFRRHLQSTAFVEGWALYSEQLADEMGLYSSDTDRFGMYSFELWRAARLVVDTGLHAKGWSREQAIDYMVENTPLARNNIVNEVDRYINTPGQALAYKTGQLEIWRLRRQAEAELGDRFVIKDFHDVVLGAGAVTLPVLKSRVEAWIDDQQP